MLILNVSISQSSAKELQPRIGAKKAFPVNEMQEYSSETGLAPKASIHYRFKNLPFKAGLEINKLHFWQETDGYPVSPDF